MTPLKRNKWPIVLITIMVAVTCQRYANLSFSDFDKNQNGEISTEEFREVFTKYYYDDWNNDDDVYLDDEDFYLTVYEMWDVDNDDILSEEEWILGYDYYWGDYIISDYEAIDIDNDGFIEYMEYSDVLDDTDFYINWDANASDYLEQDELAEGVFNIWDIDNSGALEPDEYEEFDMYYLDI